MNRTIAESIAEYINNNHHKYYAIVSHTSSSDLSFVDIYSKNTKQPFILVIEVTDTIKILDANYIDLLYSTTTSDNKLFDIILELALNAEKPYIVI